MCFKKNFYYIFLLTLCILLPSNAAQDPVVQTDKGSVRGFIEKDYNGRNIYSFVGIPFAKPPLNDLRFKDPQPPEPWQGILNTTQSKPNCAQPFEDGGSEDCLYLNVFTPKLPNGTNDTLVPVMFFIYGGGFRIGYKPEAPAFLLTKDVILVEVSYRVNVFGFLSFEDPKLGIPGNAGLKDQNIGLRWVKNNIKKFGGDPNDITISGVSAGAASVNFQVVSPMSKGLFHRAISESGVSTCPWVITSRLYKELSSALGFESNDTSKIFNYIKNASTSDIIKAEGKVFNKYSLTALGSINAFGPVVETPNDNAFLTERPEKILFRGDFNKVDYILGFCEDEGYTWSDVQPTFLQPDFTNSEQLIPNDMGIQKGTNRSKIIGDKIQYFYYKNETPSRANYDTFAKYVADLMFTYKIYNVSKHIAQHAKVYFYQFSYSTTLNPHPGNHVYHTEEYIYLYANPNSIPNLPVGSDEYIGVHRMVTLWTTFLKTGNPNPTIADPLINATWLAASPNNFHYLNIKPNLEPGKIPFEERLTFWENLYRDVFSGVL